MQRNRKKKNKSTEIYVYLNNKREIEKREQASKQPLQL